MVEIGAAVGVLDRLVAFDTTSRNSNLDLIHDVESWLARHGIVSRITLDATGRKANLYVLVGPRVAGGAALSAHVDCVPVEGQTWLADPFSLRRQDGRLIGRGTADMKGFAACAIALMPEFAAMDLQRPVHLWLTHDEETNAAGAYRLVTELAPDPPAGLSGHSSRTTETANALQAAEAVAWLSRRAWAFATEGRRVAGFEPPFTTLHVGTFQAGSILNIVPDRAGFTFEVRTVPGDDAVAVLAEMRHYAEEVALPPLRAVAPGAAMHIAPRSVLPPLDLAEDAPLTLPVQRLTGRNSAGKVSYGTEAGIYQSARIPTIVCGPGHIAQAHQSEECVAESEIASCLDFLRRLTGTLTIQ